MVIPELPQYLSSIGGEDYKGYIIALFTLTAGLSRPFSGKLADTVGRIPVMVVGALVCFISGFIYPFTTTVLAFLALRFFHGFSTGFKPTGTSAYVGDIVPFNRRGEAMGILGVSASTGMAMGPAVGGYMALAYGVDIMFYMSSLLGLLSVAVLLGMSETVSAKVPFSLSLLRISRRDIYEPKVLPPSIVMLLSGYSFGLILTIIPDYSLYVGVANKGLFFAYFTAASIFVRLIAGKASDRYGRAAVLKVSTAGLTFSMAFLALATSPWSFFLAALFLGLAAGTNTPTIFAWTIDLSDPRHRGKAMATMYIALEIGIGLGALCSGWIFNNQSYMFVWTFLSGAFFASLAFIYLLFGSYSSPVLGEV